MVVIKALSNGGLDRTLIYYPLIRNQALYPDELQDHSMVSIVNNNTLSIFVQFCFTYRSYKDFFIFISI